MTTRRGFLTALAAAIAGPMVLDPERLLWVPGAKLISIAEPSSHVVSFDLIDFYRLVMLPSLRAIVDRDPTLL